MFHNLIVAGVALIFAYALFTSDEEDGPEAEVAAADQEPGNGVVINGRKFYEIPCQTCRKLKNHREVEPRIFECVKCHRRINLNAS